MLKSIFLFANQFKILQECKNFFMDFILLGICVLSFLRGFFKGFVSMIFSLVGVFVAIFIAWQLCDWVQPVFQNMFGNALQNTISQILNGAISGQFSDIAQLQLAVSQSKYAFLFNILLFKLLGNLTIEGQMSAGQVLAPTLTTLIVKMISFSLLFFGCYVLLKLVFMIINIFVKKCGMKMGNRLLGGGIGLLKGVLIFGVIYFILTAFANLLLNEALLNFVQKGVVSNWLYDNLITKIVDFIY